MIRKTALIFVAVTATAFGGTVLADSGHLTKYNDPQVSDKNGRMTETMRGHFEHADRNSDGKVSREEMEAHMQAASEFQRMFEERNGRQER